MADINGLQLNKPTETDYFKLSDWNANSELIEKNTFYSPAISVSDANLNNYIYPGAYYGQISNLSPTPLGFTANSPFSLLVEGGANQYHQTLSQNSHRWIRAQVGGAWGAWNEITSSKKYTDVVVGPKGTDPATVDYVAGDDASVAINAAIKWGYKRVILLAGTYIISHPIYLTDTFPGENGSTFTCPFLTLSGMGPTVTTILASASMAGSAMIVTGDWGNWNDIGSSYTDSPCIENMTIRGISKTSGANGSVGIYQFGPDVSASLAEGRGSCYSNIEFLYLYTGIKFTNSVNVEIERCIFGSAKDRQTAGLYSVAYALSTDSGASYHVRGCSIYTSGFLAQGGGGNYEDCMVLGCKIRTAGSFTPWGMCTVTGNTFQSPVALSGQYISFCGNFLMFGGNLAVSAGYCSITGNTFKGGPITIGGYNNVFVGNSNSSITPTNNGTGNVIANNTTN